MPTSVLVINFQKIRTTKFLTFKAQVAKIDKLRSAKFFEKEIAQMTTGTVRIFSKNKEYRIVRIFCKIMTITTIFLQKLRMT